MEDDTFHIPAMPEQQHLQLEDKHTGIGADSVHAESQDQPMPEETDFDGSDSDRLCEAFEADGLMRRGDGEEEEEEAKFGFAADAQGGFADSEVALARLAAMDVVLDEEEEHKDDFGPGLAELFVAATEAPAVEEGAGGDRLVEGQVVAVPAEPLVLGVDDGDLLVDVVAYRVGEGAYLGALHWLNPEGPTSCPDARWS